MEENKDYGQHRPRTGDWKTVGDYVYDGGGGDMPAEGMPNANDEALKFSQPEFSGPMLNFLSRLDDKGNITIPLERLQAFWVEFKQAQDKIKEQEAKIKQAKDEFETLSESNTRTVSRLNDVKKNYIRVLNERDEVRARNRELEQERDELKAEAEITQKAVVNLNQRTEALRADEGRANKIISDMQKENDALKLDLSDLKDKLEAAGNSPMVLLKKLSDLRKENDELQRQLSNAIDALNNTRGDLHATKKEKFAIAVERDEVRARNKELEQEMAAYPDTNARLQKERDELEQINVSLYQDIGALKVENQQLKEEREGKRVQVCSLYKGMDIFNGMVANLQMEKDSYIHINRSLEKEVEALKGDLNKFKSENDELIKQVTLLEGAHEGLELERKDLEKQVATLSPDVYTKWLFRTKDHLNDEINDLKHKVAALSGAPKAEPATEKEHNLIQNVEIVKPIVRLDFKVLYEKGNMGRCFLQVPTAELWNWIDEKVIKLHGDNPLNEKI